MSKETHLYPFGGGPCRSCSGRGWHVGECHPHETCAACGGSGGDFPVHSDSRRKDPSLPSFVPWALLYEGEATAQRNHSQSVARLAQRGGLSVCEMLAVIGLRPYCEMDHAEAKEALLRVIAVQEARRG